VTGYACATRHRSRGAYQWAAEVSAYVHEEHRRSGIATCLYGALLEILAHQGYVTALAGIALPNEDSISFHEARGFERVAIYKSVGHKLGVWRDVGWWQLDIGQRVPEPRAPKSWSEVRHSDDVSDVLQRWRSKLDGSDR
jgi:phosphinothricin acetyltransferase